MKKLDHTSLACAARCEQEWVYRHHRHLVATGRDASAHFGQIVHVGVRALYDQATVAQAQHKMREAWSVGVEAEMVVNALKGEGIPKHCVVCGGWSAPLSIKPKPFTQSVTKTCTCRGAGDFVVTLDPGKLHLSLWRANKIVEEYAVQWLGGTTGIGPFIPANPVMFDCVWNEGYAESATECGLPDRAVRSRADGLLYAMDLKTTGLFITPSWMQSFEHSQQAAMQLDILEATLGEPFAGFWLDAIHIARSGAPKSDDFRRYGPLTYSPGMRLELRGGRDRKAARLAYLAEKPEEALKEPNSCLRYNRLCDYFGLCHAELEDREALVQVKLQKGELKEEKWDPRERL